jgi:NADH-quinone oxidoreductase subunit M
LFGFGILVSLFPFHTWAPKGYGAAPTGAAMLHAGVLKKFGLYGLLQIAIPFLPSGSETWGIWLLLLGLGNILVIGLVTVAQKDLKQMIGYSSVMHMGYAFIGLGTFSILGAGGVLLLLVAHGLSVALLFLLSTFIYKRFSTFDMNEMGGLGQIAPNLSAFFALAILASIGLPGFANFWGEFVIFAALAESESTRWVLYLAALGIIISAVYGLRAVGNIVFGVAKETAINEKASSGIGDMNKIEKFSATVLLGSLLLIGVYPKVFSDYSDKTLQNLYSDNSTSLNDGYVDGLSLEEQREHE